MSYILDALKKADSERRIGGVPNVHAQPISVTSFDNGSAAWNTTWVWVALAALTILAGMLLWLQPWQPEPDRAAISTASPVTPLPNANNRAVPDTQVSASTIPRSPAHGSESAFTSRTPAPAVLSQADPSNNTKAAIVEPRKANSLELTKGSNESKQGVRMPTPDLKAAKKPKATVAGANENRIATVQELPPNIQNEIPALAVSGFIYSSRPSERSVLINNKLLHEGDEVVPGITLEKMMPKEAVLNYKGYRYRIAY
jgi:general secretion pathway protein B